MKILVSILAICLLLTSCNSYSDEELNSFDEEIRAYLKKENIDCEASASGLYYKIIDEGTGDFVQSKDIVSFTYRGTFLNGKVFDEQKEPVEFRVVELIAAWKEIMLKLKEGGAAYLITPPKLGYGKHELDDIPANSILIFELQVIQVK